VALFELYIDICKGVLPVVAEFHHPVVNANDPENKKDEESQKN
jgi:hypothetical protein